VQSCSLSDAAEQELAVYPTNFNYKTLYNQAKDCGFLNSLAVTGCTLCGGLAEPLPVASKNIVFSSTWPQTCGSIDEELKTDWYFDGTRCKV
jgi:hypothetical protein